MSEFDASQMQQLQQARTQIAMVQAMQSVVLQTSAACFNMCATKADGSLSRREKACVENCVDRLADAKQLFSQNH